MPVDWETVRRNRVAESPHPMSDWDAKAAEQVKLDREAYAKDREEEAHTRDLEAFQVFAARKAETAERSGNTDDAALWDAAAASIKAGQWPIHRRLASDPEIAQWGSLRTRLNYSGSNRRLDA